MSQDIPWGSRTEIAPLIAAGRVITLRVGPSLAVADDEVDVGLTGDAPNGKWRVVASDTNGDYCVSVFNHRLSPCDNNRCMQLITVDEVFDAVEAVLAPKLARV